MLKKSPLPLENNIPDHTRNKAIGGADEIKIIDQTQDRKYFTQIPHFIDDLGLTPYAVRLYLRIKRRAGETGSCWENIRHLAEGCNMSKTQVARAKDELEQAGLIAIGNKAATHGHFTGHIITILDIWPQNMKKYITAFPVPVGDTSCPSGGTRPVPVVGRKKNPFKNGEEKKKNKNKLPPPVSLPSEAKTASSDNEGNNNYHQVIKDIKELTGYYPPKTIRELLENKFPNGLDMVKAKQALDRWVAMAFNPMNYDGWLLDWYVNDYYYQHPKDNERWNEIQHPEEANQEVSE